MADSLTVVAIAGISIGIFLALTLIITCGFCVRSKCDRKCVKKIRKLFSIPTKYEDLDITAGDTPAEDTLEPLRCIDGPSDELTISIEPVDRASEKDNQSSKPCMLQFSLFYNYHTNHLYIHIICALNVRARWYGKFPKTQIRFQLLPDIDNMYCTEIRAHGSQPIFNELFEYKGYSQNELLDLTLRLGVYTYDRFSRGKFLGYTSVPFRSLHWDPINVSILWRCMESPTNPSAIRVRLVHVSLRYEEQASRMSVIILKGISLTRRSKIKIIAPYVQVMLWLDDKILDTRQTKRKRTTNPVWNEAFLFDVDSSRIQDYSVIVRVMNYDLLLSDESVGEVVFSSRADGSELKHWEEMLKKKNFRRETAMCHQLH